MEINKEFWDELQVRIAAKQDWFNNERLPQLQEQYRIIHSCVRNLYSFLTKKSLITEDPYNHDRKTTEITVPETTKFQENETSMVLGMRMAEFEAALDYICVYTRFSVDSLDTPTIKKLIAMSNVFHWDKVGGIGENDSNTHALTKVLTEGKISAPAVSLSMISDSVSRCSEGFKKANIILNELNLFHREFYKARVRKEIFSHPEFNFEKAFVSTESELAEIRKLFTKVLGKTPFYSNLITELINEDLAPNREKLQQDVLKNLGFTSQQPEVKKVVHKKEEVKILPAVTILAASQPILTSIRGKCTENFNLLYNTKKSAFQKFLMTLRKAFNIKEKEKVCEFPVTDTNGNVSNRKIVVNRFLEEIQNYERIFQSIVTNGSEFKRLENSDEKAVLEYFNKTISAIQTLHVTLNALDEYFKKKVDISVRSKVRGLKIDLDSLKNTIVNANKKRSEFIAAKEEAEQMKKLGIGTEI